ILHQCHVQNLAFAEAAQPYVQCDGAGDGLLAGLDPVLDHQRRRVVGRAPTARIDRQLEVEHRLARDLGARHAEPATPPGIADAGGVPCTTRTRNSAGRSARYSGAASGCAAGGSESAGGAWYSVNPIWPTRAGSVPGSTGPLALRTYTPGVTANRPPSDRPA